VIKEWVRAVIYSIPFKSLPVQMLIHAVLFVVKQLNLFLVKGGLSSKLIPKQIMSGEVVQYKFCAMGFERYCQIHKEDQPRNSTTARTQGAISLGPSGNAQGGHKFYTLTTGKVVVRRAWMELPASASVIKRVHLLAKGMPAQPIFTNWAGQLIGDTGYEFLPNTDDGDVEIIVDDTLPGVHIPETVATVKIPGVDMAQGEAPTEFVDNDLNFAPPNEDSVDPPLVDTPPPVEDAPVGSTDEGIRRSTIVCTQPKPFIPAYGGIK
jgi:hypothetical protein